MSRHLTENEFQDYLDRQLQPAEALQVEQHLRCCKSCRQELKNYQKIYDALQQEPDFELPLDFARTVVKRLPVRKKSFLSQFYVENLFAVLGFAAAAVFIFYLSGFDSVFYFMKGLSPYLTSSWEKMREIVQLMPEFVKSGYTFTSLIIAVLVTLFEHAFLRNRKVHFLFL